MLAASVKHATLVAVAVLICVILGVVAAFKIPVQMILILKCAPLLWLPTGLEQRHKM